MPRDLLRVALAQINPTVGDIAGNARKIAEQTAAARDEGAALVVFPELTLTGYPPEDLLLKTAFLEEASAALEGLARETRDIVAVVGFPEAAEDVYNSAAVLADGEVAALYRKMYLPNYGVFDEQRYFQSGSEAAIFELNGVPIGLSICEDIWEPGPARHGRGARRRAGDRQPLRLPLPRRLRPRARADADPARRGLPERDRVREHGGRPGRAGLRRPQPGHRPGRADAGALPAVRGEPDALHDRSARGGRRPPARHAPPRERAPPAPGHAGGGAARGAPGERGGARLGRDGGRHLRAAARSRGRDLRRAAPGAARLRGEEPLRRGGAGAVGRDRLGARGAARRGRAGARARDLRVDALAVLERGDASGCACDRREPGLPLRGDPDRRRDGRPTTRCWPRRSPAASPTSRRRTCRPASAATW